MDRKEKGIGRKVNGTMGAMQSVKFNSVTDFLAYLPDHERELVSFLRSIVLESIPNCREQLSYNVPYYYRQRRICFIWPSAIPWGKVKQQGVLFGFCYGHLLQDDIHYLSHGQRKQVYTKTFFDIREVEEEVLKAYIFEAVKIDAQWKAGK